MENNMMNQNEKAFDHEANPLSTFRNGAEQTFNGKNGAFLFFDWRLALANLSNRAYRLVVDAVLDFQQYGTYPDPAELDKPALQVLNFILPQLERQAYYREKGYSGQLKRAEKTNDPQKINAAKQDLQNSEQKQNLYQKEKTEYHNKCFTRSKTYVYDGVNSSFNTILKPGDPGYDPDKDPNVILQRKLDETYGRTVSKDSQNSSTCSTSLSPS